MEKKCLECGEKILGRIDKKFCNDQCRNSYNNRKNNDNPSYVSKINSILKKNRRILQELTPKTGKGIVKSEKMLAKGFNLNFHTHTYTNKKGDIYYFCYDYGYLQLQEKNQFLVVNNTKDLVQE